MIVQALHEIQERYGYLPEQEMEFLALRARVPLYRVQEVASFFPSFRLHEPRYVTIQICRDMTCHLRGAAKLCKEARQQIKELGKGRVAVVEEVSCQGRCDRAPVACLSRRSSNDNESFHDYFYSLSDQMKPPRDLRSIIDQVLAGELPPAPDPDRQNEDRPIWKIDAYDARNNYPSLTPYAAVRTHLQDPRAVDLISVLKDADLRGMGGALTKAAQKWEDVRGQKTSPKYVVCNGDESEPGTFKDRELLLYAPHLVVEGVILAGLCLNAVRGYIYIRHEYREQIAAVREAIRQAKGEVPEAFESFDLEVFVSPGGYICGEETALLEAIEDRRAQPRNTPPLIQSVGLFDKPTLVNNVETLAWVPGLRLLGAEWFKKERLRFFSISGDVCRPGVFEMSINSTLRDLVSRAGGISPGLSPKAFAMSGPSGGFSPALLNASDLRQSIAKKWKAIQGRPKDEQDRVSQFAQKLEGKEFYDLMDMELDGSLFRNVGFMLGAGIIVYGEKDGESTSLLPQALNCLEFFERQSCGKCVPCRLGCQNLVHSTRILQAKPGLLPAIQQQVEDLDAVMKATSICGLGRAAGNPLTSLLKYFRPALESARPVSDS